MFSENLKKYREKLKLTRDEVALRMRNIHGENCNGTNIQNWESGTNPKISTIVALADVLGIPEQYLFNDSSSAIDIIIKDKFPNVKSNIENTIKVDLHHGYVGAGSVGYLDVLELSDEVYVDKMMVDKKYLNTKLSGLIVIGDSMEPYVREGDVVVYTSAKENINFIDGKYIITTSQGTMVKNLSFKFNGDIVISSCNQIYGSEIIKADESQEYLEIIGMVICRVLKN